MNNGSGNNSLAIFIFVAFVIYTLIKYVKYNLPGSSYVKNRLGRSFLFSNLNSIYKPYLVQYFPIYNRLSESEQILFERRVQRFINMKTFITRGDIKVNPEMKALIAGSAIQITMGYPDVYFSHFRTIIIYPDKYYSRITKQYHNGEVNQLGVIVLSWKSFMDGFRDPRDGDNLGYHEMAHALKLEEIVENNEYNFFDKNTIHEFEKEGMKEMQKVKENPENSFFRSYAATNLNEFFAVSIESYIERPQRLKDYNPNLYYYLSKILNFDVLAINPSYEFQ